MRCCDGKLQVYPYIRGVIKLHRSITTKKKIEATIKKNYIVQYHFTRYIFFKFNRSIVSSNHIDHPSKLNFT